jgi:cytoskeletal protein CcmA (bactofilin family)
MLKNKFLDDSSKICKNTVIYGSVQTENSIVIHGEILGSVISENQIKIAENGITRNSVTGKNCQIDGEVNGDVDAENEISIGSTAKITGNIICKRLKIEQNATLILFNNLLQNNELLANNEIDK